MEVPECKGTCEYHRDRDKLINDIDDVVSQHKGYWKFFFWGAGISITIIVLLVVNIWKMVGEIRDSSFRTEQSVAIGQINHSNNVMRLDNLEDDMGNVKIRLRSLEINHYEGD